MVGYHRVDQKRTEVFRKKHADRLHRTIILNARAVLAGRKKYEMTEMSKMYRKVFY